MLRVKQPGNPRWPQPGLYFLVSMTLQTFEKILFYNLQDLVVHDCLTPPVERIVKLCARIAVQGYTRRTSASSANHLAKSRARSQWPGPFRPCSPAGCTDAPKSYSRVYTPKRTPSSGIGGFGQGVPLNASIRCGHEQERAAKCVEHGEVSAVPGQGSRGIMAEGEPGDEFARGHGNCDGGESCLAIAHVSF